jgi:hypothetical protein
VIALSAYVTQDNEFMNTIYFAYKIRIRSGDVPDPLVQAGPRYVKVLKRFAASADKHQKSTWARAMARQGVRPEPLLEAVSKFP